MSDTPRTDALFEQGEGRSLRPVTTSGIIEHVRQLERELAQANKQRQRYSEDVAHFNEAAERLEAQLAQAKQERNYFQNLYKTENMTWRQTAEALEKADAAGEALAAALRGCANKSYAPNFLLVDPNILERSCSGAEVRDEMVRVGRVVDLPLDEARDAINLARAAIAQWEALKKTTNENKTNPNP